MIPIVCTANIKSFGFVLLAKHDLMIDVFNILLTIMDKRY